MQLFRKLLLSYPPRAADPAEAGAQLAAYWETLGGKDWLTDAVFAVAVREVLALNRPYLPPPGQVLDVCRFVHEDGERQEQRRVEALLPPPPVLAADRPPAAVRRSVWDRNVAIGRARQRKRNRAIAAWRAANDQPLGAVPAGATAGCDPTDAEIAEALAA